MSALATRQSVLRFALGGVKGLQEYRQLKRLVKREDAGRWKQELSPLIRQEIKRLEMDEYFNLKGEDDTDGVL